MVCLEVPTNNVTLSPVLVYKWVFCLIVVLNWLLLIFYDRLMLMLIWSEVLAIFSERKKKRQRVLLKDWFLSILLSAGTSNGQNEQNPFEEADSKQWPSLLPLCSPCYLIALWGAGEEGAEEARQSFLMKQRHFLFRLDVGYFGRRKLGCITHCLFWSFWICKCQRANHKQKKVMEGTQR